MGGMAKNYNGILGGFSGRIGPVVGYTRFGRQMMRARPARVNNPRTEAQQAHRNAFRQQVQLAAKMRRVLTATLTDEARAAGLTAQNLFVSVNQRCFAQEEGVLKVDWRRLVLSQGVVAPVGFTGVEVDDAGVVAVSYERNPLKTRADAYDEVYVYAYAPAIGKGFLSAPAHRRDKALHFVLPEEMAGEELQLWGMVRDEQGRWSDSQPLPSPPLEGKGELDPPQDSLCPQSQDSPSPVLPSRGGSVSLGLKGGRKDEPLTLQTFN